MHTAANRAFHSHGSMCASYPWEILFTSITSIISMLSFVDWTKGRDHKELNGVDVVFMTAVRCGALLYTFHQFKNLYNVGSKYIFGITSISVLFSGVAFCTILLKFFDCVVGDLKDAVFIFLLIVDLNKPKYLAQFALEANSYKQVMSNIAEGLKLMGPSITLDAITEALLIGAGTLSGVKNVEQISQYATLAIVVNYFVLVFFYPSCLSLILELSSRPSSCEPSWKMSQVYLPKSLFHTKSNPVVQGVKIIMSAGLVVVHSITHWSFDPATQSISFTATVVDSASNNSSSETHLTRFFNLGVDHTIFMVILGVLVFKYIMFESDIPTIEEYIQKLHREQNLLNSTTRAIATQTEESCIPDWDFDENSCDGNNLQRPIEECKVLLKEQGGGKLLNDQEVLSLVKSNVMNHRMLEMCLRESNRAVRLRRRFIGAKIERESAMDDLPFKYYDYDKVRGTCCENVIGYMPIPVGIAGPLRMNGKEYLIPMATTEGALVASTSRGCKALHMDQGIKSFVFKDGMTRAPVVQLPSTERAVEVYKWLRKDENFEILKESFDSTSNFARLESIHTAIAARCLFIRFTATTGAAMGMNMVAKGTEAALKKMHKIFDDLEILSISGNVCTDKKPSAMNWIMGRGKSVVCEAIVPGQVVEDVLKVSVSKLIETNLWKNFVGSSMAGSIGGNNAHAANVIAALFIACGQDPAQVVDSCACLTWMETWGPNGEDLFISVTMPSIEVGTVGGGTNLAAQSACLRMMGVKGGCELKTVRSAPCLLDAEKGTTSSASSSGTSDTHLLAQLAASLVMAGELSLMASLANQSLVSSHMKLNRPQNLSPSSSNKS